MQSTVRIDEDVIKILEELKERENMKSYNEVIRKLLKKHELSMFGADRALNQWKESEDRAKFR